MSGAIIGIDPGFSGAIAWYWPGTGRLEVIDMPTWQNVAGRTEVNPYDLLDILDPEGEEVRAVWLEMVSARPGQGVSSTFRFGQSYGQIEMAIAANRLPLRRVTAPVWKKAFGLGSDKAGSRALASQRFPQYAGLFKRAKDDGRAEAALIALYGAENT